MTLTCPINENIKRVRLVLLSLPLSFSLPFQLLTRWRRRPIWHEARILGITRSLLIRPSRTIIQCIVAIASGSGNRSQLRQSRDPRRRHRLHGVQDCLHSGSTRRHGSTSRSRGATVVLRQLSMTVGLLPLDSTLSRAISPQPRSAIIMIRIPPGVPQLRRARG